MDVEREKVGALTVRVVYDEDPINPRKDFDHLGTMVCWHGRYELGDETYSGRYDSPEPAEVLAELPKGTEIMPLYLYDHSGLSISTSDYLAFDPGGWD